MFKGRPRLSVVQPIVFFSRWLVKLTHLAIAETHNRRVIGGELERHR